MARGTARRVAPCSLVPTAPAMAVASLGGSWRALRRCTELLGPGDIEQDTGDGEVVAYLTLRILCTALTGDGISPVYPSI